MRALLPTLAIAFAMTAPELAAGDHHVKPAACRAGVVMAGAGRMPGRSAIAMGRGGAGFLIESSYEEAGWSGRLELRALSAGADGAIDIGAAPLWEAGALLAGDPATSQPPRPAPPDRKIFTLLRKADGATATVPFRWDMLGSQERAWLDPSGESRLAFLRGERARETGQPDGVFRRRTGILGDAIHSTPLLVGAPSRSVQGPAYDSFFARYQSRAEAIYLGANDGMLHAFDARDGAELFAYVPNALLPFLSQLGDPHYRHRPFVDAGAGQAEALLNGQWRSVLVSGMGMGARGVFALDVSDPAAFDAGQGALWEFTERDDPAIGNVGAAPLVARIKVAPARFGHFAVMPNDARESDTGGSLFLLALDKLPNGPWQQGVNYFKLSVPGRANALGQPALVIAADGSVRYAYAGDLHGTLWRFDFSGKPPFSVQPLFEARDETGRRQPITQAPRVVFAPGGGYLVVFGTGKSIEDDGDDFAPQSLYAVRDSAANPPEPVDGRGDLARRTLSGGASYTIKGDDFAYAGPGAKKGWYFDFPNARSDGERLAASPVLASGTVLATTIAAGADACTTPSTRTYVLDVLTGLADGVTGQSAKTAAGALPMVLELGGVSGPRGAAGGAGATRKLAIVHLQGEGAAPGVQQVEVTVPARRISWREVANWQELHDAAKK